MCSFKSSLYLLYFVICNLCIISCDNTSSIIRTNNLKSYKEQLNNKETPIDEVEFFDPATGLYSNFKYAFSFRETRGWEIDKGVGKNTVFRVGNIDSAYTISIIVIESKTSEDFNKKTIHDLVDFYGIDVFSSTMEENILKNTNSTPIDFELSKSFLKNYPCIKFSYKSLVREGDGMYYDITTTYQVKRQNLTYTISLTSPEMYIKNISTYYESLYKYFGFLDLKNISIKKSSEIKIINSSTSIKNGVITKEKTYQFYDKGKNNVEVVINDEIINKKRWYENEQLEYDYYYKRGNNDGVQKEWYKNGKLKLEENYDDGKLNGIRKEWYESGQQKVVEKYKIIQSNQRDFFGRKKIFSQKDGKSKRWKEDGDLKSEDD